MTGISRRTLGILGLILAVIAFVSLNIYSTLRLNDKKIDLTEKKQFTLSEGTLQLLSDVKEPVTLKLYLSNGVREANPFYAAYAERVLATLDTYSDVSGGMVAVEFIDPEPFSEEEDRAVGFGLTPITLDTAGTTGYFGIAGSNSTDDIDVIALLTPDRETFLEYDLTRMVFNLANPEKPVVAVITGLPINGDPALQYEPWQVWSQLGQFFDLRYMGGEISAVDEDVDMLMVVHPAGLADATRYAIDQFMLAGGKALVFVDPHSEAAAIRSQPQPGSVPIGTSSNLPDLFKAWGVELVDAKIVGDPNAARQVSFPVNGQERVIDYLPWVAYGPEHLSVEDATTAELSLVNLGTAGILRATEEASTELTPLLFSSPGAMQIDVSEVAVQPDPLRIAQNYQPGGEPLTIVARVAGDFTSAFPDGPPEGVESGGEHLAEASAPGTVTIIADTDILEDRNWLARQNLFGQIVTIPMADNASLVANTLDFLVGSDTLMGLRGRDVALRPFTKVTEIRRSAEQQYLAKEQELVARLDELQSKLSSLEVAEIEDGAVLSPEQQVEIERFRAEMLETRRELRSVNLALRQDIEQMQDRIRFLNIAAVPIVVTLIAIGLAVFNRFRFRRRFDAAAA